MDLTQTVTASLTATLPRVLGVECSATLLGACVVPHTWQDVTRLVVQWPSGGVRVWIPLELALSCADVLLGRAVKARARSRLLTPVERALVEALVAGCANHASQSCQLHKDRGFRGTTLGVAYQLRSADFEGRIIVEWSQSLLPRLRGAGEVRWQILFDLQAAPKPGDLLVCPSDRRAYQALIGNSLVCGWRHTGDLNITTFKTTNTGHGNTIIEAKERLNAIDLEACIEDTHRSHLGGTAEGRFGSLRFVGRWVCVQSHLAVLVTKVVGRSSMERPPESNT